MYAFKKIGKICPKNSSQIKNSRFGIGLEKLDRDLYDPKDVYKPLAETGVKYVRIQSGWQKTVLAKKKEKETTVKTYKEIGAIKKIDRNVVDKFIKKMIVSKDGRVELEWNFKNIFVC